jgi:hypothetical protein
LNNRSPTTGTIYFSVKYLKHRIYVVATTAKIYIKYTGEPCSKVKGTRKRSFVECGNTTLTPCKINNLPPQESIYCFGYDGIIRSADYQELLNAARCPNWYIVDEIPCVEQRSTCRYNSFYGDIVCEHKTCKTLGPVVHTPFTNVINEINRILLGIQQN